MAIVTGLIVFVVVLILFRLLRFITADADLTLLNHSLKPEFFKDKVVWVTGASSGIGEELCKQLSRLGAKVILSSRSENTLEKVLSELAHPENSRIFVLDVSSKDSIRDAPVKVKALFGRVDILINNAGVSMRSTFLDMEEDAARQLMEVNLLGVASLTRGVVKVAMLEQGEGQIVNIASIAGKFSSPLRSYYNASKFGLLGLMDSIRYELLDKDIHVTNVCPGPVNTNVDLHSLTSQGTLFGKRDAMIQNGMSVKRCSELILVSICNKLREVWITPHPYLAGAYLGQYIPSLSFYVVKKMAKSFLQDAFEKIKQKDH